MTLAADDTSELGEFSLTARLGEGGSGVVYAAFWHDRPVALKVLKESATVTDKDRARFVAEATKIRKVEHAALVSLLDAGTLPDGRPYLAMPRLAGETLHHRVLRGPLPAGEAVAIFSALAAGVAALHDAGMVHRDIKPENVFLEEADGSPRPILLDFGIARELERPDSTTTESGVVKGTPAYMAPERFFGSAATVRTDVSELAVTLYVMLAGRLPWDASSVDASGRLDPKPPSAKGASVSPRVEGVLMRALSTRPEARPSSARVFAREIEEALASTEATPARRTGDVGLTPSPAPPPEASTTGASFVATDARPASRSRLAWLGAVSVAAALAVGLLRRDRAVPPIVVPNETRATAAPLPPAELSTAPLAVTAVPMPPASYVIPPRYQPRPRAAAIDAGAVAVDPSRFYQDRK